MGRSEKLRRRLLPTELDRRRRLRVPVWRERDSAIAAKEGVEAAPTPFFVILARERGVE